MTDNHTQDLSIIERYRSLEQYADNKKTDIKGAFISWSEKEYDKENVETDMDDDVHLSNYDKKSKITCKFCSKPGLTASNISHHHISCLGVQTFNYFLNRENRGRTECKICGKTYLSKRKTHACNPNHKSLLKTCEYCKFNFIQHDKCKIKLLVNRIEESIKKGEQPSIQRFSEIFPHSDSSTVKREKYRKYYFNDEQYFIDKGPEIESLNTNKKIKKLRIHKRIRFYKYKGFVGNAMFLKKNKPLIDLLFNFSAIKIQREIIEEAGEKLIFKMPKIYPYYHFKERKKIKKRKIKAKVITNQDLFNDKDREESPKDFKEEIKRNHNFPFIFSKVVEKINPLKYKEYQELKFNGVNYKNKKNPEKSVNNDFPSDDLKVTPKKVRRTTHRKICSKDILFKPLPDKIWISFQIDNFKRRLTEELNAKNKEEIKSVKAEYEVKKDECLNMYLALEIFGIDVDKEYLNGKSSLMIESIKKDTTERQNKIKLLNKNLIKKLSDIESEFKENMIKISSLTDEEIIEKFKEEYTNNYKIYAEKLNNEYQSTLIREAGRNRSLINNTQTPHDLRSIPWADRLGMSKFKSNNDFISKKTFRKNNSKLRCVNSNNKVDDSQDYLNKLLRTDTVPTIYPNVKYTILYL